MSSHPALIGAVTVYCSARENLDAAYTSAAARFGDLLARSGRTLIYGGGRVGLMGAMARAHRAAGGRAVGIITERLRDLEQMDHDNHESIVVATMRERKALLEARADAMVVLPGGIGTLEEFFEILVGRHLGDHSRPILLLSTPDPRHPEEIAGFFDPMLRMIDHMVEEGFAAANVRSLFEVCREPEEIMARLDEHAAGSPAPLSRRAVPGASS